MDRVQVDRPEAPPKNVKTSEDFELCYLRHQYFRRVKYNPTEAEMQPYMYIVNNLTKNTFYTYFNLFKTVGMNQEDVTNIGRVHLVSFLGLYALEQNVNKKEEFSERFLRYGQGEPTDKDYEQKNKANFSIFFKQRMEDLVRVCRQKVRNVRGKSSEEFAVFSGVTPPPKNPKTILRDFQNLGYKKINFSIFKSIRKKADVEHDAQAFEFNGVWYIAIPLEQRGLELQDLVDSEYNPYENIHNSQPDTILEEKQLQGNLQVFETNFYNKSTLRKKVVLRKFIANHKKSKYHKEEVRVARRLLKTLGE